MSNPSADAFFSGGTPSVKFPQIGTTITGTIARDVEVQQSTDFDSGKPLFWDDGKPKLQAKVVLATAERDKDVPDDDGERALYVRGQMQKAITQAVRAAGVKRLEVGGVLTVTYAADGEKKGKLNPPKIYTVKYEPPDPLAAVADPIAAPTGSAATDTPPPGIDLTAWAALPAAQKATIRAAMGVDPPY